MSWVGIAIWLIVLVCGAIAVRHYRRAQIPIQQGMGLSFDERAWSDVVGGVVIGGLVMGGVFGVEWALGALRVSGVRFPSLDFALRGEPELTLRELIDTLEPAESSEAGSDPQHWWPKPRRPGATPRRGR